LGFDDGSCMMDGCAGISLVAALEDSFFFSGCVDSFLGMG
jgi:hypothetical protein